MRRSLLVVATLLTIGSGFGCGLDELIAGYAGAGGAAVGGAAGAAGQGAACATETVQSATRASFTASTTEPEEILSLDLPGEAAPDGWIVLMSARLTSESDQSKAEEVTFLVDGVERAVGHSRKEGNTRGEGGPWQYFDVLPPAAASRRISIEFRSLRDASLATIED